MSGAFWTIPAQADLAAIDDYHATRDVEFANLVGRKAFRAANWLVQSPYAGEEAAPDHRRWRVPWMLYIPVDRVVEGGVDILRVSHERQNRRARK